MKLERARGTRDFSPQEEILRQEVIARIRDVFELYGFSPLNTPIIEKYEIMTAKAGEGSDVMKEVFTFQDQGGRRLGLRYELTFPLARFIGMNSNIKLPFKRYQIGRVFRDGPIKLGRYREFWQCDVDIVGCKDVMADAEIVSILDKVFRALELDVVIEVNTRVLLNDMLDYAGINGDKEGVLMSLDKLLKIGKDSVKKELEEKGIDSARIDNILGILSNEGNNKERLASIERKLGNTEGISQMCSLIELMTAYGVDVKFNPCLARGLAYYTGPIFEVFLKDSEITSSVAGGGRWDRMIGEFLGKGDIPATGVSFGLEPITEELMKRKSAKECVSDVYVIPVGDTVKESIGIAQAMREVGLRVDMDLQGKGVSRNLDYANRYAIPYAILLGEDELQAGKITLKDMKTGQEKLIALKEATAIIGDRDE